MKKILAIGGAVIKTAKEELRQYIQKDNIEMLIHNGGSIFHDFQQETEELESHSHSINKLLDNIELNRSASIKVWSWLKNGSAPENTITKLCQNKAIPVLMFTGMACDFWQLFNDNWDLIGKRAKQDFSKLIIRFKNEFHYICMGSAVIHPEVFIKVLALSKPSSFKADVVDFRIMYRPETRVAKYGTYYNTTHKDFLKQECQWS
jgi:hypothetical protein